MHRARYGEKAQKFHCTLPESPCIVQPRSNPNPVFLDFSLQFSHSVVSNSLRPHGQASLSIGNWSGIPISFIEALLHRHSWLNHWPLVTELRPQPFSPPQRLDSRVGVGAEGSWNSNPLFTQLCPLVSSFHPKLPVAFWKPYHQHNKRYIYCSHPRKFQEF